MSVRVQLRSENGCCLRSAEVTWTFPVSRGGHAREDCHTFEKFTLKP